MMANIVNKITLKIFQQGVVDEENLPIIRYGLQAIIEVSIIVATMLTISISFGRIIEAAAWMGTIILCRSFGGGYHAKTFKSCYFISVGAFILTLVVVDIMPCRLFMPVTIACFMISIILFIHSYITAKQIRGLGIIDHLFYKVSMSTYICYYFFIIFMISLEIINSVVVASLFGFIISQLSIESNS